MAELIMNGDILFVVYFIFSIIVGIVLIAKKKAILGGTALIALSLLMLAILFWFDNFEVLGLAPLLILAILCVVSIVACLVPVVKKKSKHSNSDKFRHK